MKDVFVALGSNLGDRDVTPRELLEKTLKAFGGGGLRLVSLSRWYGTPAYPAGSGPDFVNAVARVATALDPHEAMAVLHALEADGGRVRRRRWEPRSVDLDLIAHGRAILPDRATQTAWRELAPERQQDTAPGCLVLPHPRLQDRAFVLYPLRDVAPDWVHPVTGAGIGAMIDALPREARREIVTLD